MGQQGQFPQEVAALLPTAPGAQRLRFGLQGMQPLAAHPCIAHHLLCAPGVAQALACYHMLAGTEVVWAGQRLVKAPSTGVSGPWARKFAQHAHTTFSGLSDTDPILTKALALRRTARHVPWRIRSSRSCWPMTCCRSRRCPS